MFDDNRLYFYKTNFNEGQLLTSTVIWGDSGILTMLNNDDVFVVIEKNKKANLIKILCSKGIGFISITTFKSLKFNV